MVTRSNTGTVALIRHPAPAISPRLCYGRLDVDLSAEGHGAIPGIVAETATLAPARIWSSPSRRCRLLAEAIAASHGQAPPTLDERLMELHFGAWEGMSWDDVPRAEIDAWGADPLRRAPPGGEHGQAMLARVAEFIAGLAAEQTHIVVSHGGPLRLMPALLRGETPDIFAKAPKFGVVTLVTSG